MKSLRILFSLLLVITSGCSSNRDRPVKLDDNELVHATRLLNEKQLNDANKIYGKLCDKNDRIACAKIWSNYIQQRNVNLASLAGTKACELGSELACLELGDYFFREGKLEQSLSFYHKSSYFYRSQFGSVDSLYLSGDKEKGMALAQSLCKENYQGACLYLGIILASRKDFEGALVYVKKANDRGIHSGIIEMILGNKHRGALLIKASCLNTQNGKACRIKRMLDLLDNGELSEDNFRKNCRIQKGEQCYFHALLKSLDKKTYDEGNKLFATGCKNGDPLSCIELQNNMWGNPAVKEAFYVDACLNKNVASICFSSYLSFGKFLTRSSVESLLQKGCDLGDGSSCSELGTLSDTKWEDQYKQGCAIGDLHGCFWENRNSNLTEAEKDKNDLERCEAGHGFSCLKLAERLEVTDALKSVALYDKACKVGSFEACLSRDALKSTGQDKVRVYERYCDRKLSKACYLLGESYLDSGDHEKALPAYEIGCKLEDALSCASVGFIHERAYRFDLAKKYFEYGCTLGNEIACKNLELIR